MRLAVKMIGCWIFALFIGGAYAFFSYDASASSAALVMAEAR